jgi:hypothetical protein
MAEDKSSMDASKLHRREVSLTPTLRHVLEQPERDDYHHWVHWGLND